MIARLVLVLAVVVVATLAGRWWQARHGRLRTIEDAPTRVVAATLVSTPTCRTCPQVRQALDIVAASAEGFTWDEVDAAEQPDVVRTQDIRRAPTVLFRDASGRVVSRASGAMGPSQVAAAVGVDLVATATRTG